jgi:ABC-2 type transport system ATP-binding protein
MAEMIVTRNLTKQFGPILAVDDISLSVARGEVLGFLGPNGAGKSTTMKMVAGFLRPTAGTASICGFDVQDNPLEAKRRLGYLPEGAPLYGDMTAPAFLAFAADTRGFRGAEKRRRIEAAIAKTNIEDVLGQPIETLSKGYKRRVGLAQALLHDPEVLVLDEPTDGLDPNQKHEVRQLILAMAAEKAIVISTHILEEVDAVCSRAIIIAGGRIVADGTPQELAARSRYRNAVSLTIALDQAARVRAGIETLASVSAVEEHKGKHAITLTVLPKGGQAILTSLTQLIQAHGWQILSLRSDGGHLDDVFRAITTETVGGRASHV